MKIAEHACAENKSFVMNLGAPFICQQFKKEQWATIPYLDLLFGNDVVSVFFILHGIARELSVPGSRYLCQRERNTGKQFDYQSEAES